MKRSVIISNKRGIYASCHELPNDLKLRTYPHGIFADGGPMCPHNKKKTNLGSYPHGMFAAGRALLLTQERERQRETQTETKKGLRKLGKMRKISKHHRVITLCPVFLPKRKILLILAKDC